GNAEKLSGRARGDRASGTGGGGDRGARRGDARVRRRSRRAARGGSPRRSGRGRGVHFARREERGRGTDGRGRRGNEVQGLRPRADRRGIDRPGRDGDGEHGRDHDQAPHRGASCRNRSGGGAVACSRQMSSAALIVNPFASGVTEEGLAAVERELRPSIELTVSLTERPQHATELVRAVVEADRVYVFGGDGLLNEVLNGLGEEAVVGVL